MSRLNCMLCTFVCYRRLMNVFKIKFLQLYTFRNVIRVSNGLDTDQARPFVGPDHCSNISITDRLIGPSH